MSATRTLVIVAAAALALVAPPLVDSVLDSVPGSVLGSVPDSVLGSVPGVESAQAWAGPGDGDKADDAPKRETRKERAARKKAERAERRRKAREARAERRRKAREAREAREAAKREQARERRERRKRRGKPKPSEEEVPDIEDVIDQPNLEVAPDASATSDASAEASLELGLGAGEPRDGGEVRARASTGRRSRFYFRAGVLHLHPFPQSDEVRLENLGGAATLAVEEGPVEGSQAKVAPVTIPAAIIGYVLPWKGGRVSLETILGTPVTIKFGASGTIAEESLAPEALGIPTGVPALGEELGETKALPPLVTMVYRFRYDSAIRPYAGAGLSVLIAYDSKITNELMSEVAEPEFDIGPSFGVVTQGGIEARFLKRFYVNLDLKFIAFMKSTGTVRNIHMRTPGLPLFDTIRVGDASVTVTVNPLIVQLGAGMDF